MITGGVKFFENNKALFRDGNTVSATTNDSAAKFMLDISKYTRWESIGSNDTIIETLTINLKSSETLDRLILIEHNFKSFTVKYNGGSDFTNVVGLDGALGGGISETTFDKNTAYYEFDSVSVDSITIEITTTQTVDAEKFMTQFIATSELPVQADINLAESLHEREESFLVWLCGGRSGTDFFTIEQRGWRLRDVYNMQLSRPLSANYEKGIYQNGVNTSLPLIEVI